MKNFVPECLTVLTLVLLAGCNESSPDHSGLAPAQTAPHTSPAAHANTASPAGNPHDTRIPAQAASTTAASTTAAPELSGALALFEKRILPIFQSNKPSSCSECHLSGVNLRDYIKPTQQETFVSLVAAGMIDRANPDESKILRFISRKPEQSGLITESVRAEEYSAFRAWIQAAVNDPQLLEANTSAVAIGPQLPVEVVRHARRDRVLASFVDNIWNEVGRCAACHSPDRNQKQVSEHGDQVSWITLNDPQTTLDHMLSSGLINPENPDESLLLMKPTMQVKHGGGQKMVVGDRSYKQFRRFIDDYAAMTHGKYATASQLPPQSGEVSVITDIWLKIEGVPAKYDRMLLQTDLYRHTENGWTEFKVATSDRLVFGKGNLWQHSLSLVAPRSSPWARDIAALRLPPGKYLVKLYLDQTGKLQNDFTTQLDENDFIGQVEVDSQWPAGYGQMTIVQFPE